jgi:hypothetical protein
MAKDLYTALLPFQIDKISDDSSPVEDISDDCSPGGGVVPSEDRIEELVRF